MYLAAYVFAVVGVNMLFAQWPQHSAYWSLIVGGIFILRDLAQRDVGHWILGAMVVAAALTWLMAGPFVAAASATAFIAAELIDWAVYSWTGRPLRDRILLSSAASAPVDSLIFLGMIGILAPGLFAAQVASKMAAAVIIWIGLRAWRPA